MAIPLIFAGAIMGMGISAALAPIFEPATLKLSQTIWPLVPIKQMDPGTLVIARIKGSIDNATYQSEMAMQGYSGGTSDAFVTAAEQILGPGELLGMLVRGVIAPDKFTSELTRLGVSEESASSLAQMAEQILAPDTLVRAMFRGEIDAGKYKSEMGRLGFTPESADNFEATAKIIGGPSDMIRWAVREVFTPEIVAELGLGDEFPSEFIAQAAKIGMEEEIASNEWKAHWVLPSIGQGFQMLHRRVEKRDGGTFDLSDMDRLLRVQDVMPFFRGMITQIAFQPFTRVDVRRMHKMGVLDRDEVKSAYMDRGFDDEKAEKMTEFTIQFNTGSEKELTKTEIMRALARGVIDEPIALELLSDLNIPTEAAQIIVATQAAKVAMDTTDELVDIEIDRFVDGLISEDELQDAIIQLDLATPQLELLMAKARRKNRRAEKMPSKADILRWHITGIIDRESADTLLERIGFIEQFRVIYLQESEASEEEA
ncbi:hypothetical protein LCGC14_1577260 [marine sediment metagenome]|uniref:Uncharacterized protein n=1 Tax=marine sediment metagenome TaxID=412755 RepID=A0A0F9KYV5_9ZZZZ